MTDRPTMPTLTRRRLLAAAGASLAAASEALAQTSPFPPLFPPLFPAQKVQPPPPGAQLPPGLTAPAKPEQRQVTEEDWYLESIPDGPFAIRKVNFELLDPEFRRQLVSYTGRETPGTLVVDPKNHFLYSVREGGQAVRYGVGVGREGFGWNGIASVGRKAEWPDWIPPKEMRLRQPELPERVPGGPENPLGARALYLYEGNRDTLYRIHGTAEPWTIGTNVSSGCIRMLNEEVADLYLRTPIGTRVVVL
jgi:lipoprotein-anchoring transpeptidase ErfK/SrfK